MSGIFSGCSPPSKVVVAPEEQDELAAGGADSADEGSAEPSTVQTYTMFPSSLGLTFAVDADTPGLRVTARWGRYLREKRENEDEEDDEGREWIWKRHPIEGVITLQPITEGRIAPIIVSADQPEVSVQGQVRRSDSSWIVTLFFVNGQEEPKRRKDEAWLFQPEVVVEAVDGSAAFCRKLHRDIALERLDPQTREETDAMRMLYRKQLEFAVGHHTSVHVDVSKALPDRATRIGTRTIPMYELPRQTPPTAEDIPEFGDIVFDMSRLAEMPQAELVANLQRLADSYERWIAARRQEVEAGNDGLALHRATAAKALDQCRKVLERIREGIRLLEKNAQAFEAFRFSNRAMALQRVHTLAAREVRKGIRKLEAGTVGLEVPQNRSWYPFQLAFMLINLPSLTRLDYPNRGEDRAAIADLLWFPTGGGKTEAYLGLTAYTLAMRRLQGEVEGRPGEHGVAVLMRYTLRLLTLQQFQRATALICACETIRREDTAGKWGRVPFRIGLWVGMKATPNTTAQAKEAISQQHDARGPMGYGTPAQLTFCPWCGAPVSPGRNIKVYEGPGDIGRTVLYCGDPLGRCPFTERQAVKEGIPALVVDEEIYRHPPSLLIATVDKFAQVPWKGQVQMLFGQVDSVCSRHGFRSQEIEDADRHNRRGALPAANTVAHGPLRPPDLIIQDELHLISGPLGSMVGLYETAIDELCSWEVGGKRVRPKVIASTATIRRAAEQVNRIFCRSLEVFPPHGTDITDNFFSVRREPGDRHPGRLYLGICAPGRRLPAAALRVYVALLASAQLLYQKHDTAADPWMTLVGYFNAMRELGGMRRVVDDDVRSRLRDTDKRGLGKRRRLIIEELTSRKTGTEIPKVLDHLEIIFNDADEKRRQRQRQAQQKVDPYPYDVVLATNMISVGVDVDRLGLMVVAGQPKTTAEYIQATSRVGRRHPGLVVTLYNWARPRDLSHYETFEHYHATFYQHVEALSVTPFASRALDRGLSAVMVTLIRLASAELNANGKAEELTGAHPLLVNAIERIVRRTALVEGDVNRANEVRAMLAERRDLWLNLIAQAKTHHLGYRQKAEVKGLLQQAVPGRWDKFSLIRRSQVRILLGAPCFNDLQGCPSPDPARRRFFKMISRRHPTVRSPIAIPRTSR
ncbi:MAG: DISARM system helicase DrmA [Candidatus Methylomirabilia bacterium]